MIQHVFNTGETQTSLREKYNPDGSSLRNGQLKMLEILKYVKNICDEHKLRYWLSAGTLLGAVRHEGFIPWDDDLDIEMPREDYLKLRKILLADKDSDYQLQDHSTDPFYFYSYAKLRDKHTVCESFIDTDDKLWTYKGVWIDIFILENIPLGIQKFSWYAYSYGRRHLTCKNTPMLRFLAEARYNFCYGLLFPVLRCISNFFTPNYLTTCLGSEYPFPRPLDCLRTSQKVKFEDTYFDAPGDMDGVLKSHFTLDYHLLPPEEMRGGHYIKIKNI